MRRPIERTVLGLSGVILIYIGASILFQPLGFFAANGVTLEPEVSLLSELKAPAGLLVITGCLMIVGSARSRLAKTALALGGLVYGSYGLSRIFSLILDGWPSQALIIATAIELVLAVLLLAFHQKERWVHTSANQSAMMV